MSTSRFATVEDFFAEVQSHWDADTSASPDLWTPENSALGQCAVTALLVQDHFGGTLLRCLVEGESHYYNLLPDGREIDLTGSQFPYGSRRTVGEARERAYVLSFQPTVDRYELLKSKMEAN